MGRAPHPSVGDARSAGREDARNPVGDSAVQPKRGVKLEVSRNRFEELEQRVRISG
jgi:hypothetical protein